MGSTCCCQLSTEPEGAVTAKPTLRNPACHRNRPTSCRMSLSPPWKPKSVSLDAVVKARRATKEDDLMTPPRRFGAKIYPLCIPLSLIPEAPPRPQRKYTRWTPAPDSGDPCREGSSFHDPSRATDKTTDPAKLWRKASNNRSTKLAPLTLDVKLRILDKRNGLADSPKHTSTDTEARRMRLEARFEAAWNARGADFIAAADAARQAAAQVCMEAVGVPEQRLRRPTFLPPLAVPAL